MARLHVTTKERQAGVYSIETIADWPSWFAATMIGIAFITIAVLSAYLIGDDWWHNWLGPDCSALEEN